ncbi:MAG: ABC transporter substrate-binding protein [Fusobacteriaceae bacterium]|jgi:ABC-type nitrate/sulfonate/bicarbonate transport system substrate-binding protein|nr:ABC transporter substrate-binding protein [Fusobacteriaceae bacterium]
MKKIFKFRSIVIIGLLLVLSFAISAASSTENKTSKDGKKLFNLRVVDPPVDYLEFVTAWELGFFEEEGINIEFIGTLPTGLKDLQAIEQGIIDASYSGHPSNIAQARLAGIKVKIVQPGMVDTAESPHVTYLVKKDSKIKSLDDLKGAKVGVSSIAVCSSGYVQYYLERGGWSKDDVEFLTFATSGTQEQAVIQGDIDVSTSHTPYAEITLKTGEVRSIGTTYDIFHSGAGGLGARTLAERIINEHPEVAQGFVNAMYRARVWTNDHFVEAGDLVAAVLGLNKGDVLAIYQDTNKNIDPDYLKIWFDIGIKIGFWKEGDITPDEIYTNQFVPKDAPAADKDLHWDGTPNRVFHKS